MQADARLRDDGGRANELEVCIRADSEAFEVFLLSLLLFCLSPVFVRLLLPLELQRTNVGQHHALSPMRLDVAAESERFFAKEGSFGNEVGLYPMARDQPIA